MFESTLKQTGQGTSEGIRWLTRAWRVSTVSMYEFRKSALTQKRYSQNNTPPGHPFERTSSVELMVEIHKTALGTLREGTRTRREIVNSHIFP